MVGERIRGLMPGNGINISLSVIKREAKPINEVVSKLTRDGWNVTSKLGNNRIVYLEKSGFNITAFKGPLGTVIIPSGPIRGRIFGEEVDFVNRTSSIGASSTQNVRGAAQREPAEQRQPRQHVGTDDVIQ